MLHADGLAVRQTQDHFVPIDAPLPTHPVHLLKLREQIDHRMDQSVQGVRIDQATYVEAYP